MCVEVALLAANTALSTIGAIREANVADATARAQARITDQQAQAQRNRAQFEIAQQRRQQRDALGRQVAQAGSQGTALTGQPIDLLADSAKQAELALQAIRFESEITARNLENQVELTRFTGRRQREAGLFRAGTSLLSGASKIAGRFGEAEEPSATPPIPRPRPPNLVTPPIPRRNPFRG